MVPDQIMVISNYALMAQLGWPPADRHTPELYDDPVGTFVAGSSAHPA